MQDRELYRRILGIESPWQVERVELKLEVGEIHVYLGQAVGGRFDNNGAQDVKALCVITSAAIGPQYFRESAEMINAAAGGLPDRAELAEIMLRHGLMPAPSPGGFWA